MISLLISAVLFVCIDAIYLNLMKGYFNNQVKQVQGSPIQLNLVGAFLTYIFLIYGLNYFIISKNRSVSDAFLLGIVIYAVYEFTNLSLLKNWHVLTTILDTTWGGILFALTTFLVYKIKSIFPKIHF
uniref:DUF2177 family protein n=1 Tax=viral metagenome TaxID=1070528 RepID=A0A6C0DT51_9ZZZZ